MAIGAFHLKGGLTKEQLDLIHEKALYLIETVGMRIPHSGILKLLSNYNGVNIEKENVKFREDLVHKALKESKYIIPNYAKNNFIM